MLKYHTERLAIREASLEDSAFIFELLNSPSWIQHIGDRNIKSEADAKSYIQNSLINSYEKNGFGLYIVDLLETNRAIGLCGFLKREDLASVDIGFAILPCYAGSGYTYEAASKIINQSNFEIIYGITSEENFKSKKLLEKLGLRYIRTFKFANYDEDSLLFSNENLRSKTC